MRTFMECGWPAWAVVAMALAAVVVGLIALVLGFVKPHWGLVASVFALLASCSVPGVGALGTWSGRQKVESVVSGASVTPALREKIRAVGYREAGTCTEIGGIAGVFPLLLAFAALGVGFARRKAK